MRKFFRALLAAAAMSLAVAPAALTAPAEPSPVGGPTAPPPHVHTANGNCHDIDNVTFEHDDAADGVDSARGQLAATADR